MTGEGSELDRYAIAQGFLARFPMWDWVGGRTSELSAVGLLPAALQGLDVDAMLMPAPARWDVATRVPETRKNPAALLALAWYSATGGAGKKDMVVFPYKDRLELFSRYLQQLVMESLGKRLDLTGKVVHQGIAVYGNKGSTDQHAYVQQLRDGLDNFFVTFIEVLLDRAPERGVLEVEPGVTSGDFLLGFLQGTRRALTDSGRESITITIDRVDAAAIGKLIALYERVVGFYGSLVNVNAYHQPGVEAGKKAAAAVIDLEARAISALRAAGGKALTIEGQVAKAAGMRTMSRRCSGSSGTSRPIRGEAWSGRCRRTGTCFRGDVPRCALTARIDVRHPRCTRPCSEPGPSGGSTPPAAGGPSPCPAACGVAPRRSLTVGGKAVHPSTAGRRPPGRSPPRAKARVRRLRDLGSASDLAECW